MQKLIPLLLLAGLLSACAVPDGKPRQIQGESGQEAGQERAGVRSVLGDFCPPAQALKGYC